MLVCGGDTRVGLMDADGDQRHARWVTLCWSAPRVTQTQPHMYACLRESQAAIDAHHHHHHHQRPQPAHKEALHASPWCAVGFQARVAHMYSSIHRLLPTVHHKASHNPHNTFLRCCSAALSVGRLLRQVVPGFLKHHKGSTPCRQPRDRVMPHTRLTHTRRGATPMGHSPEQHAQLTAKSVPICCPACNMGKGTPQQE